MPGILTTTEVISSANELLASHSVLISTIRASQQHHRQQLHLLQTPPQELLRLPLIPSPPSSPISDDSPPCSPGPRNQDILRVDLPPAKRARLARYANYVPEEETIRNDYSQRYVDAGDWPQNWVLGAEPEHRFEEYPKQQRLLNLKKASVAATSLPPAYLPYSELLSVQPYKFDVILLDPPFSSSFTWENLQDLPIPSFAGDPSFVFMWVGSGAGEGLERGREVLAKWGYRRCEDVVWVKTNKTTNKGPGTFADTDVIFWEGDPSDPTRKPPEMYTLIENFCLGLRRLEIFGRPSSLRRGWVTVLADGQYERLPPVGDAQGTIVVDGEEGGLAVRWEREAWDEAIKERMTGGKAVVPMTSEIDALRPKSPFRPGQNNSHAQQGNAQGARFTNGQRFGGQQQQGHGQGQGLQQNQMMVQPVMGMGMNAMGMGMGGGVDEMMGGWNPMMAGMGAMNVPGMGGMNMGNMGRMNAPMARMAMPMMGGMGMGGGGFGGGGAMFNPAMNGAAMGMGWGDHQGQFSMEGNWDGDGMMNIGVGVMGNGVGVGAMNMGGTGMGGGAGMGAGGMGMGQWGSGAGAY
ncbi:hypothetical protein H0H81_010358 [Sphagnurus paluster]|uniref:MT-A70-domain-containing protein n=1 Tax=Sphagnurus paluster TaxID=117069 RepID=A0A9P7KIK0_9AGAR|nr:hypothetical protein H0H81_010358 [Sphagnurus paluster]